MSAASVCALTPHEDFEIDVGVYPPIRIRIERGTSFLCSDIAAADKLENFIDVADPSGRRGTDDIRYGRKHLSLVQVQAQALRSALRVGVGVCLFLHSLRSCWFGSRLVLSHYRSGCNQGDG